MIDDKITQVRSVLQEFQDAYTARDMNQLDAFMDLFVQSDEIELIGIGAAVRGGNEWFQGLGPVREIIESDWTYWGDVIINVNAAKITIHSEAAWLSTHGDLVQTSTFDQAMPIYLNQMKELLENEELLPDDRFMEATHFGMRRLRERAKGMGHRWPFVLTAMLMHTPAGWRFHTIHWSMPVD